MNEFTICQSLKINPLFYLSQLKQGNYSINAHLFLVSHIGILQGRLNNCSKTSEETKVIQNLILKIQTTLAQYKQPSISNSYYSKENNKWVYYE